MMPTLKLKYSERSVDEATYGPNRMFPILPKDVFSRFNPQALGVGDIAAEGHYVQALAAIFDLQGFTRFCNQVDSHLVVPEFLSRYLDWLFANIREQWTESESGNEITLYSRLPLFVKFMGDGVMLLWDTARRNVQQELRNIIYQLHEISLAYTADFLPLVRKHVSHPPERLRCGIARGQVVSIGMDGDYVGSCINIASRLQKLANLSFAVSRRGFDLSAAPEPRNPFWQTLVLVRVELRGIGEDELVYVKKAELEQLPAADGSLFKHP